MRSREAIMMNADGLEAFAAPVTCAGPDDVAEAEVRAVLLVPTPPFPDAELTAEEEPTAPAFADVELTTEELVVAAGVDVELSTTGAVLLFAEA